MSENKGSESPEERQAKCLAFRSSWKQTVLETVIAGGCGAALSLAFPGVNAHGTAWFILVPLIWIIRSRSIIRAGVYGFVFSYMWHVCGCFWLREIMWVLPFVFAAVLASFTAVWAAMVPWVCKGILYPRVVRLDGADAMKNFYQFPAWAEVLCCSALAGLWVGIEWVRSWIFTGFPWNLLGVSQWNNQIMIQVCEYTGVYGVSFLLIYMNLALFFALHGFRYTLIEGRYKRPFPLIIGIVMVILNTWLGRSALETYHGFKGEYDRRNLEMVPVGVVQPNLSQRRTGPVSLSEEALEVCVNLTERLQKDDAALRDRNLQAMLQEAAQKGMSASRPMDTEYLRGMMPVRLVIWPETAVPAAYRSGSDFAWKYRNEMVRLLNKWKTPMLIGTIDFSELRSDNSYDLYNTALLLDPEKIGEAGIKDKYSKVHLVPFGEYVPWSRFFPVLEKWIGMGRSLKEGPGFRPLEVLPGMRAGIFICYEDVFPYVGRAQSLAGANLLMVITNDAWYPTSWEPDQHYANSIFRAVETRLPMVRCGNCNYSVLVDPSGRAVDGLYKVYDQAGGREVPAPDLKGRDAGKLMVPVLKNHKLTFYVKYGDVFVLWCWIMAGIGILTAAYRSKEFNTEVRAALTEAQANLKEAFEKPRTK